MNKRAKKRTKTRENAEGSKDRGVVARTYATCVREWARVWVYVRGGRLCVCMRPRRRENTKMHGYLTYSGTRARRAAWKTSENMYGRASPCMCGWWKGKAAKESGSRKEARAKIRISTYDMYPRYSYILIWIHTCISGGFACMWLSFIV